MLGIPIYDEAGKQVGTEELDEAVLGGAVNPQLVKQAVVAYLANQRQGHAQQLTRAEVHGSTRKLYRQKGTGNARMGNARTPIRRGGGNTFPRRVCDFRQDLPKKMRRQARSHALLAKIQDNQVCILDGLAFDAPKTKRLAGVLTALGIDRGCVLATAGKDEHLYKSGRNLPRTRVMDVAELNAYFILVRPKLVLTREAFAWLKDNVGAAAVSAAG
jgi:large subunit ribosomal protein L4